MKTGIRITFESNINSQNWININITQRKTLLQSVLAAYLTELTQDMYTSKYMFWRLHKAGNLRKKCIALLNMIFVFFSASMELFQVDEKKKKNQLICNLNHDSSRNMKN